MFNTRCVLAAGLSEDPHGHAGKVGAPQEIELLRVGLSAATAPNVLHLHDRTVSQNVKIRM